MHLTHIIIIAAAVDETLKGVELVDRSHTNDVIYKVPIVIIPGKN